MVLRSEPSSSPPSTSVLFKANSVSAPSSPSRSPRRLHTDPRGEHSSNELRLNVFKRIVVFCDGTWQDGISKQRAHYTNVLRLARSVNHEDERYHPAIPQVVFYQSGIGTESNPYSEYIEGTTGNSLADKVEEAYAFIAHNYFPGDEIFLFGFSRGAYTARMVAMFIGEIGVLDRKDMDSFASIFINYQKVGACSDPEEKASLLAKLGPWRSPDARGRKRADIDNDKFTIKCLGVWDTVGALGLPEELTPLPRKAIQLFGFHDCLLGEHIEAAFQALALNEMRADFNCTKFIQTEAGRRKNQTLKQCWFAGSHSDVGGGYKNHDLSDLTLVWMAAQVERILFLDMEYLLRLFQPVAPWGTQRPHDSRAGIFLLASKIERSLPTGPNDPETHETIHASVLMQKKLNSSLSIILEKHPTLVEPLKPLEQSAKELWPYNPNSPQAKAYSVKLKAQEAGLVTISKTASWIRTLMRSVSQTSSSGVRGAKAVFFESREEDVSVVGNTSLTRTQKISHKNLS